MLAGSLSFYSCFSKLAWVGWVFSSTPSHCLLLLFDIMRSISTAFVYVYLGFFLYHWLLSLGLIAPFFFFSMHMLQLPVTVLFSFLYTSESSYTSDSSFMFFACMYLTLHTHICFLSILFTPSMFSAHVLLPCNITLFQ